MSRLKGYLSANIRAIILCHEFVAVAVARGPFNWRNEVRFKAKLLKKLDVIVLIPFFTKTKALVDEKKTELRQGVQLPANYKEETYVEQPRGMQCVLKQGEQNIHTGTTCL